MLWRTACSLTVALFLTTALVPAQPPPAPDDLDALQEKAVKAAVARVAASVVQIETSGGTDLIGSGLRGPQIRKGTGPTSGLIVAEDGYVISSAFNFANKPAAIFVAVPGYKERLVAKVVANDTTRMLTLLKIDATGLPVPVASPKKQMREGQWALALGRTWTSQDGLPSVSVGIVSALNRIWGKAIQTDAKVSPVNYGGPLVDIQGRVLGVLVPASPRGQDETAGVEWYDAGIGFAIPLEDVNAVLPRLRSGKDLKRGLLGITVESGDLYGAEPVIGIVSPDSTAAKAGIQPGDVVTAINGIPVVRQAQILHLLGDKYDGDTVSVKVRRGKDDHNYPNLVLSGEVTAHLHAFLGVVPVRDDPEAGEEVRYVFPKSPADAAGLKPGDRIKLVALADTPMQPFAGRDALTEALNRLAPGTALRLEVLRKEDKKTQTLSVRLGTLPDSVPDQLPEPATHKKALAPRPKLAPPLQPKQPELKLPMPDELRKPGERKPGERKPGEKPEDKKVAEEPEAKKEEKPPETGLLKRRNAAGDREYWVQVPENYDANIAHAVVLWLHPAGKGTDKDLEALFEAWEEIGAEEHLILVAPKAESESGWLASESDAIVQIVREVLGQYTVDRQRVVAHGMGLGGQFAFYLGFNFRDLIRGVATSGAVLGSTPKDNVADQRLAFFVVAGGKDPLLPAIVESRTRLADHKFPVTYREIANMGHQYLDEPTLAELVRWIDALDRQ